MATEQTVRSFATKIQREMDQGQALIDSVRTRLVWFVGISGFALLNGKPFWEAAEGSELAGSSLLILSLPWLLTGLLALLTHYFTDQSVIKRNLYYSNKLAEIDLHLIGLATQGPDVNKFKTILDDEDEDIRKLSNDADRMTRLVNLFELLTFGSLAAGFAWSVIAPLYIV